jgi:DNA (cytosine-5)-methyltransferase 1
MPGITESGTGAPSPRPETFALLADRVTIERRVARRDNTFHTTTFRGTEPLQAKRPSQERLARIADRAFLRLSTPPTSDGATHLIRVVDLFSGCGVMSLGISEACRALGYRMEPVLAADVNEVALGVYKKNFPTATTEAGDVSVLVDGALGAPPTENERCLAGGLGTIDLLIGGPPCQGHSDLNNHTRRSDPKNELYARMARFAEVVRPRHIVIENVSAVLHDKSGVVKRTREHLEKRLGYKVDEAVLEASAFGTPQTRRRHVLVASLAIKPDLQRLTELYGWTAPRPVGWAISDLRGTRSNATVDRPTVATKRTERRIDYLFDHKRYDLPNSQRPKCHREKKDHTYKSVYGRMHWDRPAQTITTGFTCMGQGRFVHPKERRTITPHEAARLQFIPDYFSFGDEVKRTALAEMIGNAVPVKLTYIVGLELLR